MRAYRALNCRGRHSSVTRRRHLPLGKKAVSHQTASWIPGPVAFRLGSRGCARSVASSVSRGRAGQLSTTVAHLNFFLFNPTERLRVGIMAVSASATSPQDWREALDELKEYVGPAFKKVGAAHLSRRIHRWHAVGGRAKDGLDACRRGILHKVAHRKFDQVAATQFAVDSDVEQGKVSQIAREF